MALRFIGMFIEITAAIIILVPVLISVASSVSIDPVHLGILVILELMIGLLIPPIGMVLYVLAEVANVRFEDCVRATTQFLTPFLVVLLLVMIFPQKALWLPRVVYC